MAITEQGSTNDDDLKKFWDLESLGITPPELTPVTTDEEYRQFYQANLLKFTGRKYQARLPWKEEFPDLPTNYKLVDRRTRQTISRMNATDILSYDQIIKDQEQRRFIELVKSDRVPRGRIHYLPHRAVSKQSSTTPLRIVYDCSAKSSKNNSSLNDCIRFTPPVYNDLVKILCRFRMNKHAVTSDIEKAFLNISLHPDDRDVTRFLWLSDPTDPESPWITYRFKTVLFGATSSPFILDACLRKLLKLSDTTTASVMLSGLYVDNILTSFNTETELIEYFTHSRKLLDDGGLNLRSWKSTSDRLNRLAKEHGVFDDTEYPKILGMNWAPKKDHMFFPTFKPTSQPQFTKRQVTSIIAKIYDPLGLLSPCTIGAKKFLQSLWSANINWDQPLSDQLYKEWSSLQQELATATAFSIPRWLSSEKQTTLHVFVDSSVQAYGAAAYLVNSQNSSLIMAKSRVAPLKTLTLPRLELMAATIGARLISTLTPIFNCERIYLWSDSQIVLAWLETEKKLDVFTRNRVEEIHALAGTASFRYCPTLSNPCDLLTRIMPANKFLESSLWRHGPIWLTNEKQWTKQPPLTLTQMILIADASDNTESQPKSDNSQNKQQPFIQLIDRVSDPKRLTRVVARILRFIKNSRPKCTNITDTDLSAIEIIAAEKVIIKAVQRDIYLKAAESLQKESHSEPIVKQLSLYLDEDGLLRSRGRLHNANLPHDAKFPILLPPYHSFTRMKIRQTHQDVKHLGLQTTVTAIRQHFWIPKVGQIVRSVIRQCVVCRKHHGKAYTAPSAPPIPKMRIQDAPPFTVTGLDYTGALPIRTENGIKQIYILLMTCAVSRAVHLEAVHDMSTRTLLQAIRRFIARRGTPKIFISDNALSFEAASRHLDNVTKNAALQTFFADRRIEWRFIPKRAPWMGGFWERLVGLVKGCVHRSLGRSPVTFTEFITVMTEIEGILNNRPLTRASADILDDDPVTPADLLYGRKLPILPTFVSLEDGDDTYGDDDFRRQQAACARRIDDAWKRFRHEYLTSLREYHANKGSPPSRIKVGDMVQVYHEGPRQSWRTAVVEAVHRGNDGQIRYAEIRTSTGRTNRPISKLYPLEVAAHNDMDDTTDIKEQLHDDIERLPRPRRNASTRARAQIRAIYKNDSETDD